MPLVTLPYNPAIGPVIEVGVSAPASLAAPPMPPVNVPMLIDSGASHTSIGREAAVKAGLFHVGMQPLKSVTEVTNVQVYMGDLYLFIGHARYPIPDFRFLEFPMGFGPVQGLLGRDLLNSGMVIINAGAQQFTLAF